MLMNYLWQKVKLLRSSHPNSNNPISNHLSSNHSISSNPRSSLLKSCCFQQLKHFCLFQYKNFLDKLFLDMHILLRWFIELLLSIYPFSSPDSSKEKSNSSLISWVILFSVIAYLHSSKMLMDNKFYLSLKQNLLILLTNKHNENLH